MVKDLGTNVGPPTYNFYGTTNTFDPSVFGITPGIEAADPKPRGPAGAVGVVPERGLGYKDARP
jgi:hypothetical protein